MPYPKSVIGVFSIPSRSPRSIVALALVLAFPLGAQEASSLRLGEVTVTASRVEAPENETSPAVSVVTAEEIAERGATTVAAALEVVAGLSLSDRGAEGSQIAVSIRGSTTNQVLVLIDGVRVNDALSEMADLSRIPVESVERIEIMRGAGSSLYGGDAVGGVVNIITRKDESPLRLRTELGAYLPAARVTVDNAKGSYDASTLLDAQKASLSWSPRVGEALLSLSLGATRAANAYTFIDWNGKKRARENASLLGADVSAGVEIPFLEGELDASFSASYQDKGIPGSESSPTLNASEADLDGRTSVRYSAERFLSDFLSIDASLGGSFSSIDYADADDPSQDARHEVATVLLDTVGTAYLGDALSLTFGTSASYTGAESDTVGSPYRATAAAFAQPALGFGALTLNPALRYDFYSDFSPGHPLGGLAASLGASYRIGVGDTLKLNLARAYRVPSFNDLYWPEIAGAEGDPNLRPETAYEANLGYELRRGELAYDVVAYLRYSSDVILWQEGEDGVWRPSNYGDALYPGIEQEIKAELGPGLSISAVYTYLHSFVLSGSLELSDDKRLPMTPVHSLKSVVSGSTGRLSWSSTATFASLRYLKTANVAYLPAYFTLDVLLRWKASSALSTYVAVDNLFDEQYAIVDGYPMPGTRLRMGLEMEL